MKLNELLEKDFAALRVPFESGRQHPANLAVILLISLFLHPLIFFLTHYVLGDHSQYPYKTIIFYVHLVITSVLIILSFAYSLKVVWQRNEKAQYLISILISQNMVGVCFYLAGLYLFGHGTNVTEKNLLSLTFITLVIGIFLLYFTYKRFYKLLEKGAYREAGNRIRLRTTVEKWIQTRKSTIMILSIALYFILRFIVNFYGLLDVENILMILLSFGLFYTMLFVLPEQLVIFYCKNRFDSFNFDKQGNLNEFAFKKSNHKKIDRKV